MRKLLILVAFALMLGACSVHTCPAYAKKDSDTQKKEIEATP